LSLLVNDLVANAHAIGVSYVAEIPETEATPRRRSGLEDQYLAT
jgi:hypothetical protein